MYLYVLKGTLFSDFVFLVGHRARGEASSALDETRPSEGCWNLDFEMRGRFACSRSTWRRGASLCLMDAEVMRIVHSVFSEHMSIAGIYYPRLQRLKPKSWLPTFLNRFGQILELLIIPDYSRVLRSKFPVFNYLYLCCRCHLRLDSQILPKLSDSIEQLQCLPQCCRDINSNKLTPGKLQIRASFPLNPWCSLPFFKVGHRS